MIAVVVVAVMVVGIVAGRVLVLAPAVVLVGMFTVVVTATTTAMVTVGINRGLVEAKNRQENHSGYQENKPSAFNLFHVCFLPFYPEKFSHGSNYDTSM